LVIERLLTHQDALWGRGVNSFYIEYREDKFHMKVGT